MEKLLADLRFTFRTLIKNPGFSSIAILSLAIGIGANTAIYTLYSAIFQRDLGVTDQSNLVDVYTSDELDEYMTSSYPDFLDYREQTGDALEDLITYRLTLSIMETDAGAGDMVFGEEVSGNYFDLLGVSAHLGRTFVQEEHDVVGAAPTTVLSYTTWQRRFGSDPEIVGKTLKLSGTTFTIIGVAPRDFTGMFPFYVDMWVPITMHGYITAFGEEPVLAGERPPFMDSRSHRSLWMKGRLRTGVTVDQAEASIQTVSARLAEEYPDTNENRYGDTNINRNKYTNVNVK